MSPHICPICSKSFSKKYSLKRHQFTHESPTFSCSDCNNKVFKNKDAYDHHRRYIHKPGRIVQQPRIPESSELVCPHCGTGKVFTKKFNLTQHIKTYHSPGGKKLKKKHRPKHIDDTGDGSIRSGDSETECEGRATTPSPVPSDEKDPHPTTTVAASETPLRKRQISSDSETSNSYKSTDSSDSADYYSDPDLPGSSTHRERGKIQRKTRKKKWKRRKRRRLYNADDLCQILHINRRHSRKLKTAVDVYKITLKDTMKSAEISEAMAKIRTVLKKLLRLLKENSYEHSFARLTILSDEFFVPISTAFKPLDNITCDDIMEILESVLQSDEAVGLHNARIEATCSELPALQGFSVGSPFNMRKTMTEKNFISKKRCLLNPYRSDIETINDKYCFARCIVLAMELDDKPLKTSHQLLTFLGNGLEVKAKKLAIRSGQKAKNGATPDLWKTFQSAIPAMFQIIVWSFGSSKPIFKGVTASKKIHIFYHRKENHAYLVTSVPALLEAHHFCDTCLSGYNHEPHKCGSACPLCFRSHCPQRGDVVQVPRPVCRACDREFPHKDCLQAHLQPLKEGGSSECGIQCLCPICHKTVSRKKLSPPSLHYCMLNRCPRCQEYTKTVHDCFMKIEKSASRFTVSEKENSDSYSAGAEGEEEYDEFGALEVGDPALICSNKNNKKADKKSRRKTDPNDKRCIYGDFESTINPTTLEHRPNLLVLQESDGKHHEYWGEDCAKQFFTDIEKNDALQNATLIFHGGSGYDFIYLLEAAIAIKRKPKILRRGNRILRLTVPGLFTAVDSLQFIPAALAKFSKIFNLKGSYEKGYFGHNWPKYISLDFKEKFLPPIECFELEFKTEAEATKIRAWYNVENERLKANPDQFYCLKDELLHYCSLDVTILRLGFQQFIEHYLQVYGIHPVRKTTSPSLLNYIFRGQYLRPDSLAILPDSGFLPHLRKFYSISEVTWLEMVRQLEGKPVRHARNAYTTKIGRYEPDGVYEEDGTVTVLEFLGCRFHGCRCQLRRKNMTIEDRKRLDIRYSETMSRIKFFQDRDYNTRTIWECEFRVWVRETPEKWSLYKRLSRHFKETKDSPLSPRKSMKGGRTNSVQFYCRSNEETGILYADFCSLYPACNIAMKDHMGVWLGVPVINFLGEGGIPPEKINGLVECKVLVPQDLYLPPVPCTINGRLVFANCYTCAKLAQSSRCCHPPELRGIPGVFASQEIKVAKDMGCTFTDIKETWHFPKLDKTFLRGFILSGLKGKMEASVPDDWSLEKRLEYIKKASEIGIELKLENLEYNEGKRTLNKFLINNIWGYFGLSPQLSSDIFLTDIDEYHRILLDDTKIVDAVTLLKNDQLWVTYSAKTPSECAKTSVCVASATTSSARVELNSVLQVDPLSVLYFDTDSVIMKYKRGHDSGLRFGENIGELKNEVDDSSEISEYAALGPKCYSYQTINKLTGIPNGHTIRAKGLTLNVSSTSVLNHEVYKDIARKKLARVERGCSEDRGTQDFRTVEQFQIRRDVKKQDLSSVYLNKRLQFTGQKRFLGRDNLTYPYGYIPSSE